MNRSRRAPTYSLLRRLAAPAMVAAVLSYAAPLGAQTLGNSFGGLSESSNDPIDIESDVLVVQDKQKLATFKGNVKAVQGTTTLRAKELNVHYVGGDGLAAGGKTEGESQTSSAPDGNAQAAAGAKPENKVKTQITKIEAKGDVVITSEDDQTTTSEWAVYDLPAQLVTVGGNVVLTQGKNVLKGDRLVIDLKTGESRFENTGNAAAGGRIRALFMPKKDGKDAKPGNAKAGAAPADGEAPQKPRNETSDAADAGGETPAVGEPEDVPWPITPGLQR